MIYCLAMCIFGSKICRSYEIIVDKQHFNEWLFFACVSFLFIAGCTWGIRGTCEASRCSCKNWSGTLAMDAVCAARTDHIVLAPGELLPATIDTNAPLIGHSSNDQQQLHQPLRQYVPSSSLASTAIMANNNMEETEQAAIIHRIIIVTLSLSIYLSFTNTHLHTHTLVTVV